MSSTSKSKRKKSDLKRIKREAYRGDITSQVIKDNIEESKYIIYQFVRNNFGEEEADLVENLLKNIPIYISYSPEDQDRINGCYANSYNEIYLVNNFVKRSMGTVDLMHTIIHECAHAISNKISKGLKINTVIEESFVNIFAEMCINDYYQRGGIIKTISKKENYEFQNNGYYNRHRSYFKEGIFTRSMMYLSRIDGSEMDLFKEYFFGSKKRFLNELIDLYDRDILDIFKNSINKIRRIEVGVMNTDKYIGKGFKDLSQVLMSLLTLDDLRKYDSEKRSGLYNIENNLMDNIYSKKIDMKLEKDLYRIVGLTNTKTLQEALLKLSRNDIKDLLSYWGNEIANKNFLFEYTGFMKQLTDNWYKINNGELSKFNQIMPLIGTIPIELFETILKDNNVNDFQSIVNFTLKYKIINNEYGFEYSHNSDILLSMINEKIGLGSDFNYIGGRGRYESKLNLSENMLKAMVSIKMPDEWFQRIFKIYGQRKASVFNEDIYDSIDVLKYIPFTNSPLIVKNGLMRIKEDIQSCVIAKGVNDLNLLREIDGLYSNERIPVNLRKLNDDVETAIINLAVNGYKITNGEEIKYHIMKGDFRNIRIEPKLDVKKLNAFVGTYDTTNILFNLVMEDFLQSIELTDNDENLSTCMKLLNSDMKDKLNISDRMEKRLCLAIQNEISKSRDMSGELKNIMNIISKKHISKIEAYEKLFPENKESRSIDLIRSAVEASTYRVGNRQIIRSEDLLKEGLKEKIKDDYGISYE
ncbi:MAG: hypothetical protein HXK66_04140 [Clostridiales bacterium]|nr:hypothetical protein [Clostridiales bacterium]